MEVGAADGVAGGPQGVHDPGRIGRPGGVAAGGQFVDAEFGDGGREVGGVDAQDAVLAAGDGGDGGVREGERHHEAVVEVGVLADEVDPPRRGPDALGVAAVQRAEPFGDGLGPARLVLGRGGGPRAGGGAHAPPRRR